MSKNTSRKDKINDLKIVDNVGMTDNVDLNALTDEEFRKLEDEVFDYAVNRAKAWAKLYPED